jgi:hypothetical protein
VVLVVAHLLSHHFTVSSVSCAVVSNAAAGIVFTVDASVPEAISDLIERNGGTVKRAVTAATKYLVSTIADIAAGSSKARVVLSHSAVLQRPSTGLCVSQVTAAESKGIPVVKDTFVKASIAADGVDTVNVTRFALTASSGTCTFCHANSF